jgi:hypothetical protein
MKYQNALVKMNLKVEDFPNSTKKKISDIAKIQKELAEFEKSGKLEEANEAKEIIEDLDSQLEQTILSFDVEAHRARLQKLADMREKRWNKDGEKPAENKEKKVEPVKVAQVEQKPTPQPTQTQQPIAAQQTNPAPQPTKVVKMENVKDDKQDVEEYEEFENQGVAKKKKVNWSAIGIGVGALILTFGAVNYFKNNK